MFLFLSESTKLPKRRVHSTSRVSESLTYVTRKLSCNQLVLLYFILNVLRGFLVSYAFLKPGFKLFQLTYDFPSRYLIILWVSLSYTPRFAKERSIGHYCVPGLSWPKCICIPEAKLLLYEPNNNKQLVYTDRNWHQPYSWDHNTRFLCGTRLVVGLFP